MKHAMRLLVLALVLLSTTSTSVAQSQDTGYDLSWWTVDGGGITSGNDSGYALSSTAGQTDAQAWEGDGYSLAGGLWNGSVIVKEYGIYLPLVMRNA